MPATMKSIPCDLGFSVVTVSKLLHSFVAVGGEVRTRVLRRSKEINDQPNLSAYLGIHGYSPTSSSSEENHQLERRRANIRELARPQNVCCRISGVLTEVYPWKACA